MGKQSHHQGLAHDLTVLTRAMNRRQMLRFTVGASAVVLLGCGDDGTGATLDGSTGEGTTTGGTTGTTGGGTTGGSSTGDAPTTGLGESTGSSTSDGSSSSDATTGGVGTTSGDDTTGTTGDGTTGDQTCTEIPEETEGPYPGDGTNGANALVLSGIVRSDIRQSIGGASGIAAGVPLKIVLTLVDESCNPLADHAIYLWHCDRNGAYSMYDASIKNENYLRGVQETDADGAVTFQSIFPACYSGRWPHIHFEVYPTLASATSGNNKLKTSQLALPEDACDEVFATTGYEKSVQNLAQTSLDSDMVFKDGSSLQLPTIEGDVDGGYTVHLRVTIKT